MQTAEEIVMDIPPNLVMDTESKVLAEAVAQEVKDQQVQEDPMLDIPEDLKKKTAALKALAAIFDLLNKGLFAHYQGALVAEVLTFIRSLHEELLKESLAHPSVLMVPQLKELLERGNDDTKN